MAATRTVITQSEAKRLENLVRSARAYRELMRACSEAIAEITGPQTGDFLPDVIQDDGCTLAWMLERLGVEVEG